MDHLLKIVAPGSLDFPGDYFSGSQSAIISSRSCTGPSASQSSEEL
jgi:hypothetical protein